MKKRKLVKPAHCPWCGKEVGLSHKGGLLPHRTPGNQTCIAAGQRPFDTKPPPVRE